MKKVLIAVSQLRVGGVSKALIELLKNIFTQNKKKNEEKVWI